MHNPSMTLPVSWSWFFPTILLTAALAACQHDDDPTPEQAPVPTPEVSCTLSPPTPPGGPSDWDTAVRNNCFTNLERLGKWIGGTAPLENGISPDKGFSAVAPASVGANTSDPLSVYVLVHGWAPGYRSEVDQTDGNIKWWSDGTGNASGVWPSAWAWVPTDTADPILNVTMTGIFQELQQHDADAVVLGYTWIDDSATGGSFTNKDEVYQSEAYTNVNGLRLADAIEQALAAEFWTGSGNNLHLIGHSHGSKVATVATLTLQQRGRRVDHLTVLDSPESALPLAGNGANLLGFYLSQLSISAAPSGAPPTGTFVDNYVSFFGAAYTGDSSSLGNIVNVSLDPSKVYDTGDPGGKHSYSAAWYGGAAAAAANLSLGPLGLDWPPPPTDHQPALNQDWSNATTEREQWILSAGSSIDQVRKFSTQALSVTTKGSSGNVSGSPTEGLVLSADGTEGFGTAVFEGSYSVSVFSNVFGIAFDIQWTQPADGGYVVFTVDAPEEQNTQEVILVVDGKSMPTGSHAMSFNADISSTDFFIYYVPAAKNDKGTVKVSNFRAVNSKCESDCT